MMVTIIQWSLLLQSVHSIITVTAEALNILYLKIIILMIILYSTGSYMMYDQHIYKGPEDLGSQMASQLKQFHV